MTRHNWLVATPEAIRGYHEIGLLPEPERDSDGHRRYGYEDMIRLLWIHKVVDAGIALGDIREVLADAAPAGVDSGRDAAVVPRVRTLEGRTGLLSGGDNGPRRRIGRVSAWG